MPSQPRNTSSSSQESDDESDSDSFTAHSSPSPSPSPRPPPPPPPPAKGKPPAGAAIKGKKPAAPRANVAPSIAKATVGEIAATPVDAPNSSAGGGATVVAAAAGSKRPAASSAARPAKTSPPASSAPKAAENVPCGAALTVAVAPEPSDRATQLMLSPSSTEQQRKEAFKLASVLHGQYTKAGKRNFSISDVDEKAFFRYSLCMERIVHQQMLPDIAQFESSGEARAHCQNALQKLAEGWEGGAESELMLQVLQVLRKDITAVASGKGAANMLIPTSSALSLELDIMGDVVRKMADGTFRFAPPPAPAGLNDGAPPSPPEEMPYAHSLRLVLPRSQTACALVESGMKGEHLVMDRDCFLNGLRFLNCLLDEHPFFRSDTSAKALEVLGTMKADALKAISTHVDAAVAAEREAIQAKALAARTKTAARRDEKEREVQTLKEQIAEQEQLLTQNHTVFKETVGRYRNAKHKEEMEQQAKAMQDTMRKILSEDKAELGRAEAELARMQRLIDEGGCDADDADAAALAEGLKTISAETQAEFVRESAREEVNAYMGKFQPFVAWIPCVPNIKRFIGAAMGKREVLVDAKLAMYDALKNHFDGRASAKRGKV